MVNHFDISVDGISLNEEQGMLADLLIELISKITGYYLAKQIYPDSKPDIHTIDDIIYNMERYVSILSLVHGISIEPCKVTKDSFQFHVRTTNLKLRLLSDLGFNELYSERICRAISLCCYVLDFVITSNNSLELKNAVKKTESMLAILTTPNNKILSYPN